MVGHPPNVHFLRFKVEQVHESRLGHGRVSGLVVCGPQKSAKSGSGRDIRDAAPAPGLRGGNVDAGGPSLLNNSNIARVEKRSGEMLSGLRTLCNGSGTPTQWKSECVTDGRTHRGRCWRYLSI